MADKEASSQTDREQEQLKEELERLKRVRYRKGDPEESSEFDEDDDDDLDLCINTDEDETIDGHYLDGAENAACSESYQMLEIHLPDGIVPGFSQDSMGSIGFELNPNRPEVCLEVNMLYQEAVRDCLKKIHIVLEVNRQRQVEVNEELQEQATEKSSNASSKRKALTIYCKPYFKDLEGSFPPQNKDTLAKRINNDVDPMVRPPKSWSSEERTKLRSAVQADRLQAVLRPYMNKKELEHEKLRTVLPDSEEEKQIQSRLDELDEQIALIRSSTDVNDMFGSLEETNSIDWMKIAYVDLEGLRTPESCQLYWLNAGHPLISTGKWTAEEDKALAELIGKYDGVCWKDIARDLGRNRSAFQCLQRFQTKLNPCLLTGKWTPEEDNFLRSVASSCREGGHIIWNDVAYYMEGRSREQCVRRWQKLHPSTYKKGRWHATEDLKLIDGVQRFGISNWWRVKDFVPGRSSSQCRERWKNTLDQSINFGNWSYEEDRKLWVLVQEFGVGRWQKLVDEYLPGRTDNMALQRYRRLLQWKDDREMLNKIKPERHDDASQLKSTPKKQHYLESVSTSLRRRKYKAVEASTDEEFHESTTDERLDAVNMVSDATRNTAFGISCITENGTSYGTDTSKTSVRMSHDDVHSQINGMINNKIEKFQNGPNQVDVDAVTERQDNSKKADGVLQQQAKDDELARVDRENGLYVPRPATNASGTRNYFTSTRYRLLLQNLIEKRIEKQLTMLEKDRLITVKSEAGTNFARTVRKKLLTLTGDGNATIREILELSSQVQQQHQLVVSKPASPIKPAMGTRGRQKKTEQEQQIESKIGQLLCEQMAKKRKARRHHHGLSANVARLSVSSYQRFMAPLNVELVLKSKDIEQRITELMTKAMNYRRMVFAPQVKAASQLSDTSIRQHVTANLISPCGQQHSNATLDITNNVSQSAILMNSSESQNVTAGIQCVSDLSTTNTAVPKPFLSVAKTTADCPSTDAMTKLRKEERFVRGRPSLIGPQARIIYTLPALMPNCATLNAFQSLLLDRSRLLGIAGKFHVPGILGIPLSAKQKLAATANKIKVEPRSESVENAMASVNCDNGNNELPAQPFDAEKRKYNKTGKSKLNKKTVTVPNDHRPVIITSKAQSKRLLKVYHATHDYHMLRSRFKALFLWPALLSTMLIATPTVAVNARSAVHTKPAAYKPPGKKNKNKKQKLMMESVQNGSDRTDDSLIRHVGETATSTAGGADPGTTGLCRRRGRPSSSCSARPVCKAVDGVVKQVKQHKQFSKVRQSQRIAVRQQHDSQISVIERDCRGVDLLGSDVSQFRSVADVTDDIIFKDVPAIGAADHIKDISACQSVPDFTVEDVASTSIVDPTEDVTASHENGNLVAASSTDIDCTKVRRGRLSRKLKKFIKVPVHKTESCDLQGGPPTKRRRGRPKIKRDDVQVSSALMNESVCDETQITNNANRTTVTLTYDSLSQTSHLNDLMEDILHDAFVDKKTLSSTRADSTCTDSTLMDTTAGTTQGTSNIAPQIMPLDVPQISMSYVSQALTVQRAPDVSTNHDCEELLQDLSTAVISDTLADAVLPMSQVSELTLDMSMQGTSLTGNEQTELTDGTPAGAVPSACLTRLSLPATTPSGTPLVQSQIAFVISPEHLRPFLPATMANAGGSPAGGIPSPAGVIMVPLYASGMPGQSNVSLGSRAQFVNLQSGEVQGFLPFSVLPWPLSGNMQSPVIVTQPANLSAPNNMPMDNTET